MLAGKQECCDLQFKWINADFGRKSKNVVIFNLNGFIQMLAGKGKNDVIFNLNGSMQMLAGKVRML